MVTVYVDDIANRTRGAHHPPKQGGTPVLAIPTCCADDQRKRN